MITVAEHLEQICEAALFASPEPLTVDKLGQLFSEAERPDNTDIKAAVEALQARYQDRALELVKVASGYRFQARVEFAPWLQRLWERKPPRYTRALLETLALIVYRQPVTRGEIEDVRGVAVSANIIKTLMEREWIRVVGHRDVPGKPALFGTTKTFLDYFNLKSLSQLPPLKDIVDLDELASRFAEQGEMLLEINQAIEARNLLEAAHEDGAEETAEAAQDEADEVVETGDAPEPDAVEEEVDCEPAVSVEESVSGVMISEEVSDIVAHAKEVADVAEELYKGDFVDDHLPRSDAPLEEDEAKE